MSSTTVEKFEGAFITEDIITAAAKFFSENYGVWGASAAEKMGSFAKHGSRVKMSPRKLREQILPSEADNVYIRMLVDGELAGNVFGTRWIYDGRPMLWITQLCVSQKHRNKGIAKTLLESLRSHERGFGILSSHPFAIRAILRVFGRDSDDINLEMTKAHARAVMKSCPVEYVKEARLWGNLFDMEVKDGSISSAFTNFWVDHAEPLEALEKIKEKGKVWPLGELLDGHEFLVLVKVKAIGHEREGQKSSEF